ncbi:SCO7613 C-terminal domain-containing membrane protein [Homoserinimonas sp. A447]
MPPADNYAEFRNHAGTVLWPTSPGALTDTTRCPACFTPLKAIVCTKCGLDLGHPAAAELAAASQDASDSLSQRVAVIGRIRYESSQPRVPAETVPAAATTFPTVAAPTAAAQTPAAAAPAAAEPVTTAPEWSLPTAIELQPTPPVNIPAPAADAPQQPGAPRRSGVQVALLIAGVSLLSIFAIFFLVYAFINYGIVWRSVIIASITVAAFVSASLLRRKSLIASAEGLAVFALVLVYLDAYALRANDFFGLGGADSAVYWGATVSIASVFFIAWHRLSQVRAASIVGWAGIPVGIGILLWGLMDGAEPATRVFTAFAATAVTGLAHGLVPRPPFHGTLERMLVLSTSSFALLAAFMVSWAVEPFSDWGGTMACAAAALTAFALAASATADRVSTPAVRAFGLAFATIGGVAAASAVSVGALRVAADDTGFAIFVPVIAAAAIALLLEASAGRWSATRFRAPSVFATWGAAGVLALTALLPLATAAMPIGTGLVAGLGHPWTAEPSLSLTITEPPTDLAVLALACVVGLAAAAWLLTGSMRQRGTALAWGTGVVLILAAAQLPQLWLVLAGWLGIGVAAFVLLLRTRATTVPAGYRVSFASVLVAATTLMFLVGWASLDTWLFTTAATIVTLLASRALTAKAEWKAIFLGLATVLLFVGVVATARFATWEQGAPWELVLINETVLLTLVATIVLAAAAIDYRRFVSTLDRQTTFWIAGVVAGASAFIAHNTVVDTAISQPVLMLPQPVTSLVSAALLLGALLLWVGLRVNASLRPERIVASIALAPAVFWLVDSFARVLDLSEFAQSVVPITAALLSAAGALTVTLLRPTGTPRWAREAGVAIVGVPAVVAAIYIDAPAGWLVLVLAGVTLLLIAISPDGLFASGSPRRHLGWAALAVATAGLWWRLSSAQVEALEPYVLPLAGALLAIAYLIHRAARRAQTTGKAAPIVALCSLLVAILPLAANSVSGDPTRAIVMFAVCAALLLVSSLVVRSAAQPFLDAMALSGAIGVLVTAGGRASLASHRDLEPDGWIIAALAVLLIAAFGQSRERADASARARQLVGQALVIVGMVSLAAIETEGFFDETLGTMRAIATVALLCAIHIIAYAFDSAPLTRLVATVAVVVASLAALMGLVVQALDPIELASVPIAIALLVTGRIRLGSEPDARSWRSLAPGLAVLMVPSLLNSFTEPELWRLVGLGVVAVTVLVVGAVRRLQAPFVLGLVVALIHGFATFAPQIRAVYESQEWWLWAGLAGVLLVILAIRYEKRIQNLKDAVGRIAALR